MPNFVQITNSWKGSVPTCLCLYMLELGFRSRSIYKEHLWHFYLSQKMKLDFFWAIFLNFYLF